MNYSISIRRHNIILLRPVTFRITQNIYGDLIMRYHSGTNVGILCIYDIQDVSVMNSTSIYTA